MHSKERDEANLIRSKHANKVTTSDAIENTYMIEYIYIRVAGRVRTFALLKRPQHKCQWDALVAPLKVSQPHIVPWRRRYKISWIGTILTCVQVQVQTLMMMLMMVMMAQRYVNISSKTNVNMIFRYSHKFCNVRDYRRFTLQVVSAGRMQRKHMVTYIFDSPAVISKHTREL